jgi:hypothetical protein
MIYQEFALNALAWRRLNATSESTFEELLEYHLRMANTNTEIMLKYLCCAVILVNFS